MPLAGRMKLADFLLIGAILVATPVGLVAGYTAWRTSVTKPIEEIVPVRTIAPPPDPATIEAWQAPPERLVDQVVLEHAFEPMDTDKIKDLAPERPFKINLYQDEGYALPNRVKIDLDRDGKWDEKWSILDGIMRDVAPADDEEYTERYRWDGSAWIDESGKPALPDPKAPGSSGDLIADTVMNYRDQTIAAPKLKDVTRNFDFKINVYQDEGHTVVNRAKVDLDRDEKWDEKWTFHADRVVRKISPSDDESYTKTMTWTPDSGWVTE